jgi:hypothetical protein
MDGAEHFLSRLRLSLHRYNFPPGNHLSHHESYEYERMRRMANVAQALWFAKNKLPSAVRSETGEALDEVLSGILPALLMALVVVAASSLVGASIGAIAGGVFGLGVGAVPGAIAGGTTGFTAGMWILEWMGLAFLAVHVGKNMYQVGRLLESGFNDAWGWGARDQFAPGSYHNDIMSRHFAGKVPGFSQVTAASEKFAQAVAVLIRLVLEGIVLYLTARGIAKLPELVAQLRNSHLGAGFATWVEQNHLRLMNNPKLKRTAGSGGGVAEKPVRVLDHTGVPEQPRPGRVEKGLPPLRQKYEDAVTRLRNKAIAMRKEGYSEEEIARTLHAERRALGVKYKNVTPPDLLKKIYQRNEEKYGDPLGPSIDYLRSRGKSWEQISESACRPGGKDLGF